MATELINDVLEREESVSMWLRRMVQDPGLRRSVSGGMFSVVLISIDRVCRPSKQIETCWPDASMIWAGPAGQM